MYYCVCMENFRNFMQMLGLSKAEVKEDSMVPTYIKADGTKVIEQNHEYGKTVYEISPNGLFISRNYDFENTLRFDYARKANYEIAHNYDEYGKCTVEINSLYNEHNVCVRKTQMEYKYYDNGNKSNEIVIVNPGNSKTEINYDENGELTEKIIYQGSVKTYYDKDGKPFKRVTDRGSGGIITENL